MEQAVLQRAEDEALMRVALEEAHLALESEDVPVGALVVKDGRVIARGHNRREADHMASAHAELLAIENACRALSRWRLSDCTLYVTLEPCPMCAGAIINARISRVVFGARDAKAGVFGSVLQINDLPFNHHPELTGDVLADECGAIISEFFARKRAQQKAEKKREQQEEQQ